MTTQKELFKMPPKNKNKEYTIDELELIFSLPPTKENATRLAKILWRSVRAITNQYQRAMLTDNAIEEKNKKYNAKYDADSKWRRVAKSMWRIQTY